MTGEQPQPLFFLLFSSLLFPEQQSGGVCDELDVELDAAQTLPVAEEGEQTI